MLVICVLLSYLLRIFLFVVRPDVVYNLVLESKSSLLKHPPLLYIFHQYVFPVVPQCTVSYHPE